MGEHNKHRTLDLLLLQLAVINGEMTIEQATDAYMDKWITNKPKEGTQPWRWDRYCPMGYAEAW